MTYLTDDLLAAIRREHSCPECSGHFDAPADSDSPHEGPPISGMQPGDVGGWVTAAGMRGRPEPPAIADGVAGSLPVWAVIDSAGTEAANLELPAPGGVIGQAPPVLSSEPDPFD